MPRRITTLLLGEHREAARIAIIAAITLTLVGLCSGLAVFAIFAHEMENEAKANLTRSLNERERFFSAQLIEAVNMASDVVNKRPRLRKLLGFAAERALTPEESDEIKLILNNVMASESGAVQALRLTDSHGAEISSIGKLSSIPGLGSQVLLPYQATLFWRNGYHIQMKARFVNKQAFLGEMDLEIALAKLTDMAMRDQEIAQRAGMLVCFRQAPGMRCFPNSHHDAGLQLTDLDKGIFPLLQRTLEGVSEISQYQNGEGIDVIATTKPVGNSGLAMMIRIDAEELGKSARAHLLIVLPLLGALVLLGVLLLRWRLAPLVHQLLASRAKVKAVIDGSAVGIITKHGEVIDSVNPAAGRIFGYDPASLVGRNIHELIPEIPFAAIWNGAKQDVSNIAMLERETTGIRQDGSTLPLSLACSRMQTNQQNLDIAMMQDISARKAAEAQLLRNNEELRQLNAELEEARDQLVLSEKMASLGNLVAGISHEVNTPIGIGVTAASTLHEYTRTLNSLYENGSMTRSDLEQYLARAQQSADILMRNLQRASDLIRSFKQVAVDQSSEDWRTINMHEYCEEILLSLAPKIKNRQIRIVNACDPALSFHTQPGAIYQIISNLVLNSLMHGFEAEVSGEIHIQARQSEDKIEIVYSDNGKGVSPEHLNHIFDPFFTTKRGQGGSGLGLSIIYNLVHSTLKGRIMAASTPGQGITFHLALPVESRGRAQQK